MIDSCCLLLLLQARAGVLVHTLPLLTHWAALPTVSGLRSSPRYSGTLPTPHRIFVSHDTLSLKATGRPCYDPRTASSARSYPSTR